MIKGVMGKRVVILNGPHSVAATITIPENWPIQHSQMQSAKQANRGLIMEIKAVEPPGRVQGCRR